MLARFANITKDSTMNARIACLVFGLVAIHPVLANTGGHHGHSHTPAKSSAVAGATAPVSIDDCWIRLMPSNLPMAAYFRMKNTGQAALKISSVSSDDFSHTMLHQTQIKGGMADMSAADNVVIASQEMFVARPGGYHVMLEKPAKKHEVGDNVKLNFEFSPESHADAQCKVQPSGYLAP